MEKNFEEERERERRWMWLINASGERKKREDEKGTSPLMEGWKVGGRDGNKTNSDWSFGGQPRGRERGKVV